MFGISYGGISQLFTAQTRPPDLEAIAPLSVLDATGTTLYAGGILNTGFAVPWAEERQQNAEPAAPGHGQAWAYERIQSGDTTCAANQALHGQASNLLSQIRENATYDPTVADPLDPITFVHDIDVPTFMACQWQDEQTGGHCADLAEHFTGTRRKWFTFTNGAHIDSLDPYTYDRLYDFLELFVAHRAPIFKQALSRIVAPIIYLEAMGIPLGNLVTLPPDPIQTLTTYRSAMRAFEALPAIRVLFDNGAGTSPLGGTIAGDPYPGFEDSFSEFPIPGTTARSWYLGPKGTLTERPAAAPGSDSYTSDASATPLTDYSANTGSGGLWGNASQWEWNWLQPPAGSAVSYVSAPLTSDATAIGGGAVHLWMRSSTPDVDLQATVSEVRPDGNETFVQNGWLRGSERKLATSPANMLKQQPTLLQPIPTFLASDEEAMPANRYVPVVIPLYFEGHVYRAGLARPGHDLGAQRNAAGVVVRADPARRVDRHGVDRLLRPDALQPDPPDRPAESACRPACRSARACATSPAGSTSRSPTTGPDGLARWATASISPSLRVRDGSWPRSALSGAERQHHVRRVLGVVQDGDRPAQRLPEGGRWRQGRDRVRGADRQAQPVARLDDVGRRIDLDLVFGRFVRRAPPAGFLSCTDARDGSSGVWARRSTVRGRSPAGSPAGSRR